MKNVIILSITMLACLAVGFFIGRFTVNEKRITKWEKGETVFGSVNPEKFNLVSEEKPTVSILYRDTGSIRYIPVSIDTAALIADYELKRKYSLLAFDNKTQGKLELFPTIQYNKLAGLDYSYTPVIEKQYIYKTKVWQPFVSASYSTLNYIGIGGGVLYHNLGFEYQYSIDIRSKPMSLPVVDGYFRRGNYHWFSGKYKF